MTIGRVDINEKDISKIAGAVIQLEERADADDTGVVRTDTAQSLTSTQQTQARSNIYAAPFDALAYNGLQINGSMEVSQELGVSGLTATGYIADGWAVQSVGVQTITAAQLPTTTLSPPAGFNFSIGMFIGTANVSPAAGDYCAFYQPIEGYRVSRLGWGATGASPISFGFWVWAIRPGIYSGVLKNGGSGGFRSYAFTFTINSGSVWEYKTITVPGDTSGTWTKDNGIGLYLQIAMMCGSTFRTAAGIWTAGNFVGATGAINGVASSSDIMAITGVVVLPGIEAPSAARSPLIMRPYDQELLTCQRYYYKTSNTDGANYRWGGGAGAAPLDGGLIPFKVIMRAIPTIITVIAPTYVNCTLSGVTAYNDMAIVSLVGTAVGFYVAYGGTYAFDARL